MSEEEQRIAIAKACGWKMYEPTDQNVAGGRAKYKHWIDPDDYFGKWDSLPYPPDYLNNLNAMHDAVMSLSEEQRSKFRKELQYLIAPDTRPNNKVSGIKVMGVESYDKWFHATAPQRAEAFLKTIGKWKD
jgi:hypothetical protein